MTQRLILFIALICFLFIPPSFAQIGNEWIDFDKTYYKFRLSEDGIYRIPKATLDNAGLSGIPGSQFRLYHSGAEVPLYTSSENPFSDSDYIEFYGERNRGEADRVLYSNPDLEQLNPDHSMFTDWSAYFLTWDENGQGLRITPIENDLSNPPAAETYYLHKDEWIYSDHTIDPISKQETTFISYSRYQEAEGFGRTALSSFGLDIASTLVSGSGPDGSISVRLASSTWTGHQITAYFGSDTLLNDGNFSKYHLYQLSKDIPVQSIDASLLLDIRDLVPEGRFTLASIQWVYPRQYDFSNRTAARFIHKSNGNSQYFELQNFVTGGDDPIVYDRTSMMRLEGSRDGNTVRFLLPAFTGEREIVISNSNTAIHTIDGLTERTFTDYTGDNTEYIIITHPSLRDGADVVGQYAQYRSSAIGGGYNTRIYSIDDLCDQFGYGIDKHPQSIRNFNKLIQQHWSVAKMVLIIGKGITYTISRAEGSLAEQHLLVPTFGNPGADHLLFTTNGISMPPFPIGRLPVANQQQLQAYLSKVIEHDLVGTLPQTLEDRSWTKHIMHLGGGVDALQQGQLLGHLNQMASYAESNEFGAHVSTFSKSNTNETGEANSEAILKILKSGLSVVKFFGHSSASTLDFQINNPRIWENKGKYPIFSAMGCRAGDIHQNYVSLSENFVFEPDAGAIAFVAGSGSQYITPLASWGKNWYLTFSNGVNSLTLGESIVQSLAFLDQSSHDPTLLIEQQTLTGDPALRYYATPGPDYLWDYASVRTSPDIVTVRDESIILSGDIINIGTNTEDSARVTITQKFPDGHLETVYSGKVVVSGYRTTLNFTVPVKSNSSGQNTYYVEFDSGNDITELPDPQAESNNTLINDQGVEGISVYILDNRALATYPLEFAIITEHLPVLTASSTNAFIKGQTFVMEIDTTAEFNSPTKHREYFKQFGGVLKWKPIITYQPGTVYYWRVSTDSISPTQSYVWDMSSFLYNPGGQRGWNQSHYHQFLRDNYDQMHVSEERRFEYTDGIMNVWVQNAVDTTFEFERFKFFIDNANFISYYRRWRQYEAHVAVAVFDPKTGETLKNPIGGLYGAINPVELNRILPVFPFSTATPESRNALMTFIEDIIPSGHFVALYTYQRHVYNTYYPEQWAADSILYGRNIFSVIENIYPQSRIRNVQNGSVPYTLLFQKDVGALNEQVATDYSETTNTDANFTVLHKSGDGFGTLVGPASRWSEAQWEFDEKEAHDTITLTIYGIRPGKSDSLLVDRTTLNTIDLSHLDVKEFPYIRLQLYTSDTSDLRSSPQLKYWRVLYEGLPEFVYNPNSGFEFHADSLRLGDNLHFKTVVENVSPYPADPFTVSYYITDVDNNLTLVTDNVPALMPGDTSIIEMVQPIVDNAGDHLFLAELNTGIGAAELHHFNNFGVQEFYVIADQATPSLDVTFDGRYLLDRDVISASPEVIITLLDENPLVPLTDREHFELYIQSPTAFDFVQIDLASPEIIFIPSDPDNGIANAQIIWHPLFIEDGLYFFRVNAKDASDNKPVAPYEISFEILGEARITDLKVVPNPFSDFVRFSFTLTGYAAPESFTISITDVAGRLIRLLDEEDLGTVYVGSHHLDMIWDGRSESGDRVADGMYFYRIEAKGQNGINLAYDRPNGDVGKILFIR